MWLSIGTHFNHRRQEMRDWRICKKCEVIQKALYRTYVEQTWENSSKFHRNRKHYIFQDMVMWDWTKEHGWTGKIRLSKGKADIWLMCKDENCPYILEQTLATESDTHER